MPNPALPHGRRTCGSASQVAPTIIGVDAAAHRARGRRRRCSSAPPRRSRSGSASASSRSADARASPARPCCRPAPPTCSPCCGRSTVVLDADDRVVRASPAAYSFGLVRERAAARPTSCSSWSAQVRRDGEIREVELELPRGPLGSATHRRARRGWRRSGRRLVLRAGRGPHRGPPGRRGPPRLRRQRQPRAEDPGRRAGAARRGARGRGRRPGGRPPVRRPDAARGRPADPRWSRTSSSCPGCRAHDPLPDAGAGRAWTTWSPRRSTAAGSRRRGPRHRRSSAAASRGLQGAGRRAASWSPRWATWSTTRSRYSPSGTRVAVVDHRGRRPGRRIAEISVTDQGIGIPEAEQDRIFERFYRVDPARSRATGGTGLGLAIVKHVAANHGGEVTVWSDEGTGSTFTLRLPAAARRRPDRRSRRRRTQ